MSYADANGGRAMPPEVVKVWAAAINKGHPSGGSLEVASLVKALLEKYERRANSNSRVDPGEFRYEFTSGRDEANTLIITSCVNSAATAARGKAGALPHVVVGAGSSPSVLECLRQLRARGTCTFNYAHIDAKTGTISSRTIRTAMRGTTCLVTVPAVTILGSFTNLKELEAGCFAPVGSSNTRVDEESAAQKMRRVPLHADVAVLHGVSNIYPDKWGIDAYSMEASLIGGPPGFGALALRESLQKGFGLRALIAGRPHNLPGLAATTEALKHTAENRAAKNSHLVMVTEEVVSILAERLGKRAVYWYPSAPPCEHAEAAKRIAAGESAYEIVREGANILSHARDIVFLSPPGPDQRLPNTLVLAVRNGNTAAETKRLLEYEHGVVCADLSEAVAEAPLVPHALLRQAIRISFPDEVAKNEAEIVAKALERVCRA